MFRALRIHPCLHTTEREDAFGLAPVRRGTLNRKISIMSWLHIQDWYCTLRRLSSLLIRCFLHLMELFAFFVCQALVQITEIGFRRCLFEEFNEICLRLVVELSDVVSGFVYHGHQLCQVYTSMRVCFTFALALTSCRRRVAEVDNSWLVLPFVVFVFAVIVELVLLQPRRTWAERVR